MRTMAILGATGSIGTQAIDLVRRYPDRFQIDVLTAHSSAEPLYELVREFRPKAAGLVVEPRQLPDDVQFCDWYFGADCSERALFDIKPDDALCAVVGVAGLGAVMRALDVCERVLLANKEALVTGGMLVMDKARKLGKSLLPVDSEHSAIFQCLEGAGVNEPKRLILTASGGPFRTWEKQRIDRATLSEALGHPTWRMGGKITIDCATMMNKGLEVIEAHYLFAMPPDRIDVTVHPQSVVHSMVEFMDGSVMAQMGLPDMRAAIGYAMGYPERLPFGGGRLDLNSIGALTFEQPDLEKFPCLRMAYEANRAGGAAPTILNAANEVAVGSFLRGEIQFGSIEKIISETLAGMETRPVTYIEDIHEANARAMERATRIMKGMKHD